MPVYKREGNDPNIAWNEVIRQVNELAEECELELLDEVDANHIWTVEDVDTVQEKLIEICEDNSFTDHHLWHKNTIDEIVAAIENGACCEECEDTDLEELGGEEVRFLISQQDSEEDPETFLMDWAGWIMMPVTPLVLIEPEEEEPYREGGWGWVGRQYAQWEVWLGESPVMVASGSVVDGYIQIAGFSTNEGGSFSVPSPGPDPEPTPNGDWIFPYELHVVTIQEGVGPPANIPSIIETQIRNALGTHVFVETVQAFPEGDPGGDPIVDNPFTFANFTFLYANSVSPYYAPSVDVRGFLRLICA